MFPTATHRRPQPQSRSRCRQFRSVGRKKLFIHTTNVQHHSHFSTPVVFSNKEWSNTGFRVIREINHTRQHHLHQQLQVESLKACESWIKTGTHGALLRLLATQSVILPVNPHVSCSACRHAVKVGLSGVTRHSNRSRVVLVEPTPPNKRRPQCLQRLPDVANTEFLTQSKLLGGRTQAAANHFKAPRASETQKSTCFCCRRPEPRPRDPPTTHSLQEGGATDSGTSKGSRWATMESAHDVMWRPEMLRVLVCGSTLLELELHDLNRARFSNRHHETPVSPHEFHGRSLRKLASRWSSSVTRPDNAGSNHEHPTSLSCSHALAMSIL